MATTYSPSLSTDLSRVRFKLGDIGDGAGGFAAPLYSAELPDETLNALLEEQGSVLKAAAVAARALAAKYAKMVDVDVDNQLTRASQRFAQYTRLAAQLEEEAAAGGGSTPNTDSGYAGGPLVFGIGDTRGPLDEYCTWPPYCR